MHLDVSEDDLVSCVACGLCLSHCPTYRVTGEESASPRGRIAAMRRIHLEGAEPDAEFVSFMDACVQCRGCESACPSGVPFGRLMEGTRHTLSSAPPLAARPGERAASALRRIALRSLAHHRLLLGLSSIGAVAQRARLVPRPLATALGLPAQHLPLRRPPRLRTSGDDVWFFPGCVMDAWMRDVHHAARRLVEATGAGMSIPETGGGAGCCGALIAHAGLLDDARSQARRVMASMPGDQPILVDSAGCGAAMSEYGHLLGTDEAAAFAGRVQDISTWLAERLDLLPPNRRPIPGSVVIQDPCHLRHVQQSHLPVRAVVARALAGGDGVVLELDDEGLCCGAGGAYASEHPAMAGAIRERKLAAIARAWTGDGSPLVASANPGCALHLTGAAGGRGAPLVVRHPVDLLDHAIRGTTP